MKPRNGVVYCEAMQRAFQRQVREKYGAADALCAAWRDPQVRFDTVSVPTEAEWKAKRETLLH
ncbi:MAG: hypothetical protein WCI17_07175 [bacterium]